MLCFVFTLLPYPHKTGRFQVFFIIQALCRLPYLVVVRFQKAQYLVVFFFLFHQFFGFLWACVDILLTYISVQQQEKLFIKCLINCNYSWFSLSFKSSKYIIIIYSYNNTDAIFRYIFYSRPKFYSFWKFYMG